MDITAIAIVLLVALIFWILRTAVKAIEECKIRKALEEYDRRIQRRMIGKQERDEMHRRAKAQRKQNHPNIPMH